MSSHATTCLEKTTICLCSTESDKKELHTYSNNGRAWEVRESDAIATKCGDAIHIACLFQYLERNLPDASECPFCHSAEWLHLDNLPAEVEGGISGRLLAPVDRFSPGMASFSKKLGITIASLRHITNEAQISEIILKTTNCFLALAVLDVALSPFLLNSSWHFFSWIASHTLVAHLLCSSSQNGRYLFKEAVKKICTSAFFHQAYRGVSKDLLSIPIMLLAITQFTKMSDRQRVYLACATMSMMSIAIRIYKLEL